MTEVWAITPWNGPHDEPVMIEFCPRSRAWWVADRRYATMEEAATDALGVRGERLGMTATVRGDA